VVPLSPRSARWLAVVVEQVDDGTLPIAEICRRAGKTADELQLTRPSYEQVRTLVHRRRARRPPRPGDGVELGVALRLGARLALRRPRS